MKGIFDYHEDKDVKKKHKKHKKSKKHIDVKSLVSDANVSKKSASSKQKESKITINLIPVINYNFLSDLKELGNEIKKCFDEIGFF